MLPSDVMELVQVLRTDACLLADFIDIVADDLSQRAGRNCCGMPGLRCFIGVKAERLVPLHRA
jgi:hypothetical protein